MRSRLRLFTFMVFVVVIALIQVACELPTRGNTPTPEVVAECTTVNNEVNSELSYPLPLDEAYVPREVIITGNAIDIARVLAEIPEFEQIRAQGACSSVILELDNARQEATGRLPLLTIGLETRLYPLPENVTPVQAMELIYAAVWQLVEEDPENPPIVFADPNYILGYDVDGDPSNGHSGIGGTTVGPLAALPPLQNADHNAAFWNQWAFGPAVNGGIEINNGQGGRNSDLPIGEGPTIVLFDTSPYPAGNYELNWVDPALLLEVLTPVPVPGDAPGGDLTIIQHGVYAAGLAHAVAPGEGREKILVRVLNDTAQGDLFSLLRAINFITERSLAEGITDRLVYNFSLGITPRIDDVNPPQAAIDHIQDLIAREIPTYSELLSDFSLEQELVPIPALRKTFIDLYALGITSIAAAGNDSKDTVMPTQRPAAYPEVIGVAATEIGGAPSCFSNVGQLAAPGGAGSVDVRMCDPKVVTTYCRNNEPAGVPSCDLALISLVTETAQNKTPNGFAYWIGTSFSTPMVSGLSALLMSVSASPLLPEDVAQIVNSGTSAGSCAALPIPVPGTTNVIGTGIISVPQVLNNLNSGSCAP